MCEVKFFQTEGILYHVMLVYFPMLTPT